MTDNERQITGISPSSSYPNSPRQRAGSSGHSSPHAGGKYEDPMLVWRDNVSEHGLKSAPSSPKGLFTEHRRPSLLLDRDLPALMKQTSMAGGIQREPNSTSPEPRSGDENRFKPPRRLSTSSTFSTSLHPQSPSQHSPYEQRLSPARPSSGLTRHLSSSGSFPSSSSSAQARTFPLRSPQEPLSPSRATSLRSPATWRIPTHDLYSDLQSKTHEALRQLNSVGRSGRRNSNDMEEDKRDVPSGSRGRRLGSSLLLNEPSMSAAGKDEKPHAAGHNLRSSYEL